MELSYGALISLFVIPVLVMTLAIPKTLHHHQVNEKDYLRRRADQKDYESSSGNSWADADIRVVMTLAIPKTLHDQQVNNEKDYLRRRAYQKDYESSSGNSWADADIRGNLLSKLHHYELVVPVSVDSQGKRLGNKTTKVADTKTRTNHRFKRSSSNGNTSPYNPSKNKSNPPESMDKQYKNNGVNGHSSVYYNLTAFNNVFHLQLTPSEDFISPLYRIEHYGKNRKGQVVSTWFNKTVSPLKSPSSSFPSSNMLHQNCHYVGSVRNEKSTSYVALSDCNGLFGVFFFKGERYFIEPLVHSDKRKHSSKPNDQVHIIYKESSIKVFNTNNSRNHFGNADVRHGNGVEKEIELFWWQLPKLYSYKEDLKNNCSETDKLHSHTELAEKWKKRKRRRERSISEEKYVETLVVVDKKMVDYHGKDQIEPFVLSVMNVVAKLYHDASIGNSISIVITRLVLLLEDQEELTVGFHADKSLQSFCKWQQKINPQENSHDVLVNGIAHHDNAILLTRYDICAHRDEPCGTLGLAPVAGMCDPERSCSIVEDIGLATAFTVAHELGHNFGMQHEGAGNDCGLPGGRVAKLMASQLTKDTNPFQWSACSREYITAFLDSGRGKCLDNEPPHLDFDYPEDMPGQYYSPDSQCQMQYGSHSVMCKPHLLCRELYCINPLGECITNSIPAADGTPCDYNNQENGWCFQGDCVGRDYTARSVDGTWNNWSGWGQCSRTCGGGVESSERRCDNPRPRNGGKFCTGERKRYRSCHIHDCPQGTKEFRVVQCAKFDSVAFRGKFYKWKPYTGAIHHKPCALNCLADGFNFYTERAPKVIDGTPCYPDSLDICINGECMTNKVGCDKILGSEAKEDKCRVCSGDGSSCTTVKGFFSKPFANMTDTYREVLVIAKDAVNILIKETTASRNYIAIKTAHDNMYYINGHWTIDWPRKVQIANTVFHYKRPDGKPENIFALGPIEEDIVVMLLLQEENLGIEYEYNMPITPQHDSVIEFGWKYTPWSTCTVTCATGKSISEAICVRQSNGSPVDESHCEYFDKPEFQMKKCNTDPCEPEWRVGVWSSCSKTCNTGFKTRSVICIQKKDVLEEDILDKTMCTKQKPKTKTRCHKETCPPHWVSTDEWSKCKPSCGPGTQTRHVYCITQEGQYQPDYKCKESEKPTHKRECNNRDCVQSNWVTQDWEQCNEDCGRGLQKREITCISETGEASEDCNVWEKPQHVRECMGSCLPKSDEECVDREKVTYCPLVIEFKFCSRAYFYLMCCRTCRNAGFKYSDL